MQRRTTDSDGIAVGTRDGRTTTLSGTDMRARETVERRIEIRCTTGRRTESTWRGVPLGAVVEDVPMPDGATHLVLSSADGYRCCVGIRTAFDGLIAFARDGDPVGGADESAPRFVAPGVEGARCLKNLARIDPASLEPGEDPATYENLPE